MAFHSSIFKKHIRIGISFSEDEGTGISQLQIDGDRHALTWLGEVLIAVGATPGYHEHIDDGDRDSLIAINLSDVRLTISNLEKVPPKKVDAPSPPDWARGD